MAAKGSEAELISEELCKTTSQWTSTVAQISLYGCAHCPDIHPKEKRTSRMQLLSNAFGANRDHEETKLPIPSFRGKLDKMQSNLLELEIIQPKEIATPCCLQLSLGERLFSWTSNISSVLLLDRKILLLFHFFPLFQVVSWETVLHCLYLTVIIFPQSWLLLLTSFSFIRGKILALNGVMGMRTGDRTRLLEKQTWCTQNPQDCKLQWVKEMQTWRWTRRTKKCYLTYWKSTVCSKYVSMQ